MKRHKNSANFVHEMSWKFLESDLGKMGRKFEKKVEGEASGETRRLLDKVAG